MISFYVVLDVVGVTILFITALIMCIEKVRHSVWIGIYFALALEFLVLSAILDFTMDVRFWDYYFYPGGLIYSVLLAIWLIKINVKDKKQP